MAFDIGAFSRRTNDERRSEWRIPPFAIIYYRASTKTRDQAMPFALKLTATRAEVANVPSRARFIGIEQWQS